MDELRFVDAADVARDDLILVYQHREEYAPFVAGIFFEQVCILHRALALILFQIQALRALQLVVLFIHRVEFFGDDDLRALRRLADRRVAELPDERQPVVVRLDLSVLDGDDGHVARGAVFRDDRDEGDEYDHGQQHDREELDARSL